MVTKLPANQSVSEAMWVSNEVENTSHKHSGVSNVLFANIPCVKVKVF